MTINELIKKLEENPELLEIARKAIEDELIYRRDARISILRNNGSVCKEFDGTPSHIIRLSHEEAILIGLQAISEAI